MVVRARMRIVQLWKQSKSYWVATLLDPLSTVRNVHLAERFLIFTRLSPGWRITPLFVAADRDKNNFFETTFSHPRPQIVYSATSPLMGLCVRTAFFSLLYILCVYSVGIGPWLGKRLFDDFFKFYFSFGLIGRVDLPLKSLLEAAE